MNGGQGSHDMMSAIPWRLPAESVPGSERRLRNVLRSLFRSYWTESGLTAAKNLLGLMAFRIFSQCSILLVILFLGHALAKHEFGAFVLAMTLQPYMLNCFSNAK